MVGKVLGTAIKAEHEIEKLMNDGQGNRDIAEQEVQELRNLAERATLSCVNAAESWGKEALDKTKDITMDDVTIEQ